MSVVIKAGQTGAILQRLSTVDLADHLREARTVVEAAQRRAAQTIQQAEAESVRLRELAQKEGYQTGHELGLQEGKTTGYQAAFDAAREQFNREQASVVKALERATQGVDALKDDLELRARRDLLTLAVACARKLTFDIGTLHPQAAQANLERALKLVGDRTDIRIRVNPADVESIKTYAPSVLAPGDDGAHTTIEADDDVSPGGCTVETKDADVDATLDTQMDQLVALLLGESEPRAPASGPGQAECHD